MLEKPVLDPEEIGLRRLLGELPIFSCNYLSLSGNRTKPMTLVKEGKGWVEIAEPTTPPAGIIIDQDSSNVLLEGTGDSPGTSRVAQLNAQGRKGRRGRR